MRKLSKGKYNTEYCRVAMPRANNIFIAGVFFFLSFIFLKSLCIKFKKLLLLYKNTIN